MPKLRQRQPRVRDEKYLDAIRDCVCLRCGFAPRDDMGGRVRCDAAHVRYADDRFGKPITGNSTKPDDRWSLPLCPRRIGNQGCHMLSHDHGGGERDWWESLGIDATMLCHRMSQDYDLGFKLAPWALQAQSESYVRRHIAELWPAPDVRMHMVNGLAIFFP
jgi:hypothetical protein